ncbi:MAG: MBL fold metallo-hydrolase [Prolixibacteraceae bacterium]|nr:MBL fold metallo-hydrolase [Prolixibacteraceae bacterium]
MNLFPAAKICILFTGLLMSQASFEKDVFQTDKGELTITFIGHGTLMMEFNGKVIHIDPVAAYADYSKLPKADLILVTHNHGDHLDKSTINLLRKESTEIVLTKICHDQYGDGKIMNNGDAGVYAGINIEAVPAYNIKHMRSGDTPYHPRGEGNGYILNTGNKRIYIAGDTENIPEMANLKDIDIAFLPMNLPYTMTPGMVVESVKMFNPGILYPYHFGNTDTKILSDLMKNHPQTEVRIRKLN